MSTADVKIEWALNEASEAEVTIYEAELAARGPRPSDDDPVRQKKWDERKRGLDLWLTRRERLDEDDTRAQLVRSAQEQIAEGLLNGDGTVQELSDNAEQMLNSPAVLWGLSNELGEERAKRGIAAMVRDVRGTVARWLRTSRPTQVETGGWSAPVSLDIPVLPPLPADVFPPWLDEMVEATAVATETPRELSALTALGIIATALQGKYVVEVKPGYCEPLSLWVNTALDSGNRKTAVVNSLRQPLDRWSREQTKGLVEQLATVQSQRATVEARIGEMRSKAARQAKGFEDIEDVSRQIAELEKGLPELPRVPQLWAQDVTPEKLAGLMADNNERIAIISDEGGIFDILEGRYSSGVPNLDLFLQGHTGSPVRVDRVSRDAITLEKPALTMVLSTQPEVLLGLASTSPFRGRGLLARFLYALPISTLGYRRGDAPSVPIELTLKYEQGIRAMLDLPVMDDPITIVLSEDAYRLWLEFSQAVEGDLRDGGRFERIKDWAGKLPGAAVRIAGNLDRAARVFDGTGLADRVISAETMEKALDISAVLSSHALAVFDLMGADDSLRAARKVWSWINRNQKSRFTFRDTFQALRGSYSRAEELDPAFRALEERFYLRELPGVDHTPGRPRRLYEVNPAFTGSWGT